LRRPFALLRHWPLTKILNVFGAHALLGIRAAYLPCRLSPKLVVIGSKLPRDDAAIAVGRAMQRLWLQATLLGMSIQPLAASTVLPMQTSDEDGTTEEFRQSSKAKWKEVCGAVTPYIVLRVGWASATTIRSSRPEVGKFIKEP
jgi:hypothetical protein